MKFINANRQELYQKLLKENKTFKKNQITKGRLFTEKILSDKNSEKKALLDEDLSYMSLFFSEVILVVINKIIFVLNTYKMSEKEIENNIKKDKNKKTAYPISELEILNLFYKLFPEKKREVILENLTKLKEFISSDIDINILQIAEEYIKEEYKDEEDEDIPAFTYPNHKNTCLENIIYFNSDLIDASLHPIYFVNEDLYGIILHELTHLSFNSTDKVYYHITHGSPYFLEYVEFAKDDNLSDNADNYMVFILTSAIFMEKEPENNIRLKKFNIINKGYEAILHESDYSDLEAKEVSLNEEPATMEQLKHNFIDRKNNYEKEDKE